MDPKHERGDKRFPLVPSEVPRSVGAPPFFVVLLGDQHVTSCWIVLDLHVQRFFDKA